MRQLAFTHFLLLYCLSSIGQTVSELQLQIDTGKLEDKLDAYISLTDIWSYNRSDSALWAAENAVKIARQLGDYASLGISHKVASICYGDVGLYDIAIDYSYRAISYYDSSSLASKERLIAEVYHNLAWYFAYMEDFSKPAKLFHTVLQYYTLLNKEDSIDHTVSFHALGSYYYLYEKEYDSAIFYLKKTISWRSMLDYNLEDLVQAEVELCQAYLESNRLDEGRQVLDHLKSYDPSSVSLYVQNYTLFLESLSYFMGGDYTAAYRFILPVYQWGDSVQLLQSSTGINLMRQLVETAKLANMPVEALSYLERLRSIEQETIYKDRQRVTKALEMKLETSRKEQQLKAQENRISQKNTIIYTISIGALFILSLSGFLFFTLKKLKRKNKQVETLMRELHHRVKNNLQVISSLLGLQSSKLTDVTAQRAVEEGQERIRAMSLIHQKLYQQSDVSSVNIKEYLETLVHEISDSYGYREKAELKIDIPTMPMDVDTTMPLGLIVNELVSNSFKYAYQDIEKPLLKLELMQSGSVFHFSIKDNGNGLPINFDLEQATSFGLKLVRLLVKQLGGKLKIDQSDGLEYMIEFQTSK